MSLQKGHSGPEFCSSGQQLEKFGHWLLKMVNYSRYGSISGAMGAAKYKEAIFYREVQSDLFCTDIIFAPSRRKSQLKGRGLSALVGSRQAEV
jgi:hypothetical protein